MSSSGSLGRTTSRRFQRGKAVVRIAVRRAQLHRVTARGAATGLCELQHELFGAANAPVQVQENDVEGSGRSRSAIGIVSVSATAAADSFGWC